MKSVKELVNMFKNKCQIRKDYFVTIINAKTGTSRTDFYKLSKKERKITIDEIYNDPELQVVNCFNNGIVAMI